MYSDLTAPVSSTDCLKKTFNQATADFYNSTLFKQVAAENAAFLQSLPPYLDGRAVTLENMVGITLARIFKFLLIFFSSSGM